MKLLNVELKDNAQFAFLMKYLVEEHEASFVYVKLWYYINCQELRPGFIFGGGTEGGRALAPSPSSPSSLEPQCPLSLLS